MFKIGNQVFAGDCFPLTGEIPNSVGEVECCNLRAQSRPGNVVAAERISTAAFCAFPGRNFLQTVNTAFGEMEEWAVGKKYMWTRKGLAGQRQMREMDPAQVYGHRPKHEDVWFLSPY